MRKTLEVRITAGTAETNRDHGKLFVLEEMSAMAAERWAADALRGLTSSGVELPDDLTSAGTLAIATLGLKALGGMPGPLMEDLMDRMMKCVTFYPNPQTREIARCPPAEFTSDIEEISTLLKLRTSLLELHTGFSLAGVQSLAASRAPAQN